MILASIGTSDLHPRLFLQGHLRLALAPKIFDRSIGRAQTLFPTGLPVVRESTRRTHAALPGTTVVCHEHDYK